MATEQPKPAAEDVKMDLFEDDDEFEEFEIDQGELSIISFFYFLVYLYIWVMCFPDDILRHDSVFLRF